MSTLRVSAPAYIPLASRSDIVTSSQSGVPIILDVPPEVISIVFKKLQCCREALMCGLVCKPLLAELSIAPLSFCLSPKAFELSSSDASAYVTELSLSFQKYFPGLDSLDMCSAPVEDRDVLGLCQPLKKLHMLNLSGCKKLKPRLCGALISTFSASQLHSLNLQRCFQLNGACLRSMLDACADGSIGLGCLAMSHLDLNNQDVAKSSIPLGSSGSKSPLSVLALNNCSMLNAPDLVALAALCPRLTHLFLGGSSFHMQLIGQYLAVQQEEDRSQQEVTAPGARQHWPSVRASVEACPAMQGAKYAAATRDLLVGMAVMLVNVALALPCLLALELSFMPQPVVAAVTFALANYVRPCAERHALEVWDLTQESGVRMSLAAVRRAELAAGACVAGAGTGCPQQDFLSTMVLALKCAVSCSSSARATPLHTAAFGGNGDLLGGLLQLGAVLDARDVGGATALFLAAEAGRPTAVRQLLGAGADPAITNAAGESPLYIASLKGHLDVVKVLVLSFVSRRVPWYNLRYADGWTPLMAAVVADHYDVAHWLLAAAGADAALDVICAANRYGQSVLHIAARKGSTKLLRLLLDAGGFSALGIADCAGDTPMDVALKHSHRAAVSEFARVAAYA